MPTTAGTNVSPLVAAMRAYLMWEYEDEVPAPPPAGSASERNRRDPEFLIFDRYRNRS